MSAPSNVLVLGTRNAKKQRELEILLRGTGIEPVSLSHYPNAIEVDETGTTFAENARLKAAQQAVALGQWVLGEDSGLCVDALGGAPGVISARFSGDSVAAVLTVASAQRRVSLNQSVMNWVSIATGVPPLAESTSSTIVSYTSG